MLVTSLLLSTGIAYSGINPDLANIPTNTWVKLSPKSYDANGVDVTTTGFPWNAYSGGVYDSDLGAILMFGGGGHGGRRGNDVWMYDIAKNEWREQYLPDPQSAYPYALDDSGMTFSQYCQSADPQTCNPSAAWLPRGTTTTKRPWTSHSFDQMAYDQYNHKMVFFGPNFIFGYGDQHYYGVPDAYAYDVASKTWSHYTTIPLNYHQMSRCDYDPVHHLVVAAGRTWTWPGYSWLATATCWVLDVTTGIWSQRSNPPIWGGDANLVWDSIDQVMIQYGQDYPTTADLYTYNPQTDVWTKKTTLPDPVAGYPPGGAPNASFDSNNGVLLILGRSDAPDVPTWTYSVRTNRWTKMNATNEPGDKVAIGSQLIYDPQNNVFFLNANSGSFETLGGMYGELGELYAYRYGAATPDTIPPARTTDLTPR